MWRPRAFVLKRLVGWYTERGEAWFARLRRLQTTAATELLLGSEALIKDRDDIRFA